MVSSVAISHSIRNSNRNLLHGMQHSQTNFHGATYSSHVIPSKKPVMFAQFIVVFRLFVYSSKHINGIMLLISRLRVSNLSPQNEYGLQSQLD